MRFRCSVSTKHATSQLTEPSARRTPGSGIRRKARNPDVARYACPRRPSNPRDALLPEARMPGKARNRRAIWRSSASSTLTSRRFHRRSTASLRWPVSKRPPVQALDAVYFDTPGKDLARNRITLRRRTGGPDAGWHLKLPEGTRRPHRDPRADHRLRRRNRGRGASRIAGCGGADRPRPPS